MKVAEVAVCRYSVPLRTALLTARGEMRVREGLLVRLLTADGAMGYGEAAPHPHHPGGVRPLLDALKAFVPRLQGMPLADVPFAVSRLPSPLAFALETAALDALARVRGVPLAHLLAHHARDAVPVSALVAAEAPCQCAHQAAEAMAQGFRCLKLKVGALPLERDVARLRAVREATGGQMALRLDANGAWSPKEASRAIAALAPFGLEYVEQPLPPGQWRKMARLRRQTGVAIAADEDVTGPEAARALLEAGAADVLVLKPGVVGGLGKALQCARLCQEAGARAVVTTTLETAIGTAAALHLAAVLPWGLAAGLGALALLTDDLGGGGLKPRNGLLHLASTPGLGIGPDGDALARHSEGWTVL